jgi:hypothetical protein
MQAPTQIAHHLLDATSRLLFRPEIIWPIIAGILGFNARWHRQRRRMAKKRNVARAVRGWLTVPAAIDVVSVAEHMDSDGKKFYLAALTYFYRRPDLEMGDYQREFAQKTVAQEWVKQFKGRQVMVHVNPKNVAESFVQESDLEGLETHQTSGMERQAQSDPAPSLSSYVRFLSALGEQLSIAGLAGSAMLLSVSLATGGMKCPHWLLWTGGAMLAVSFLLMIVVQTQCRGNDSAKNFLHSYKFWSPVWMQWALKAAVAVFFILWILDSIRADLPLAMQLWMKGFEAPIPYILSCLGFLATASFHTAVQRSQEQIRLPVSGA